MTTYLDKALSELAAQKVVIKEVRGLGLMKGIELSVPAAYYINSLQEAGIIVIPSGSHVIRLLPPLILEKEHIDALLYTNIIEIGGINSWPGETVTGDK